MGDASKSLPCDYGPTGCECYKCRLYRQQAEIKRLREENQQWQEAYQSNEQERSYLRNTELSKAQQEIERLLKENHEILGLLETALYAYDENCWLTTAWYKRVREILKGSDNDPNIG